ncbi:MULTISPECIES: hypothetical protein [Achromobacter]
MELSFFVVTVYHCTGQIGQRKAHDCVKRNKTCLRAESLPAGAARYRIP